LILLDATAFLLLVNPEAKPPMDPATGQPVTKAKERLEFLQAEAERQGETIVIPSPALAEVLVGLDDAGPAVLDRIARSARFIVAPFDTREAVEVAAMTRDTIRAGDKKDGSSSPWQKVKIDRQIIAIARVHGVQRIYSDDGGVATFAEKVGIPVIQTWALPLPPENKQQSLFPPSDDV
jgi:predicted nucleic acid-binding protein